MGGRDGSSGRPVPPSPSLCREAEPGDLRECPLGRVGFTVGFAGYGGGEKVLVRYGLNPHRPSAPS